MDDRNIIRMLHDQRKIYEKSLKFHYKMFVLFVVLTILYLVFLMVAEYVTLNGGNMSVIVLMFLLIIIEGKQCIEYSGLIASTDNLLLSGEL